jgi:TRAP-type C4-dicarboxylate transport system permease small subunit
MRALRTIARAHDLVTDFAFVVAVLSLMAMLSIYVMEVVLRYFFASPTRWGLEVVQYLLIYLVFLAVPHVTRIGAHVSVSILIDSFPRFRQPARWFTIVAGTGMCLLAAWFNLEQNLRQFDRGIVTQGNVPLPKWWFSSAITVGFAGAALYFLRTADRSGALEPKSWLLRLPTRTGGI